MQNRSFLGSIPPVTLNLIIVNFIVWLAALTLPKIAGINLNYWLGLHYFAADDFNVVQLITYMFLHDTSGIEHIFFNMFSVFMFGRTLEAVWGGKRFLFYYITTGMGAALVQEAAWYFELRSAISETVALYGWEQTSQLLNNFITVGASGAAFGILLAFGMLFPNAPLFIIFIPIPIKAKYFVFHLYSCICIVYKFHLFFTAQMPPDTFDMYTRWENYQSALSLFHALQK